MFDVIDNTAVQNVVLNDTQTTAAQAERAVAQASKSLTQVLGLLESKRIAWEEGPDGHPNSPTYGHPKFPHPGLGVRVV